MAHRIYGAYKVRSTACCRKALEVAGPRVTVVTCNMGSRGSVQDTDDTEVRSRDATRGTLALPRWDLQKETLRMQHPVSDHHGGRDKKGKYGTMLEVLVETSMRAEDNPVRQWSGTRQGILALTGTRSTEQAAQ
jgi:hypothetical protein